MAAKDKLGKAGEKLGKAGDAAKAAQENPYLQRLIEDEDVRANLLAAYDSAKSAAARMGNGTHPAHALFEDRKLQGELKDAAGAIRDASSSLKQAPKSARKHRGKRSLLLLAIGAALAVALSEGLRSKVLDTLFGAEEEFDYSSTTAPAAPAPAPVAAE